jgi:hypothetical protein
MIEKAVRRDVMSQDEIVGRLNELLEAERAGVEAATGLATADLKSYTREDIRKFGEDEGWACSGLRRAIVRYGGILSSGSGDFGQRVMALESEGERLNLLARGQAWVVKRIDLLLAMELDSQTRAFLVEMRELHLQNLELCNRRAEEIAAPPSPPYRGLLYAHIQEAHDRLYYGPWRSASASPRDLQRAHHQLGRYLDALEREVGKTGSVEAKTYLDKAQGAYLRADPRSYPEAATLNLDNTLSYAHRALNCLLRGQGTPSHDPVAFESYYDMVEVPFREII